MRVEGERRRQEFDAKGRTVEDREAEGRQRVLEALFEEGSEDTTTDR